MGAAAAAPTPGRCQHSRHDALAGMSRPRRHSPPYPPTTGPHSPATAPRGGGSARGGSPSPPRPRSSSAGGGRARRARNRPRAHTRPRRGGRGGGAARARRGCGRTHRRPTVDGQTAVGGPRHGWVGGGRGRHGRVTASVAPAAGVHPLLLSGTAPSPPVRLGSRRSGGGAAGAGRPRPRRRRAGRGGGRTWRAAGEAAMTWSSDSRAVEFNCLIK